MRGRPLGGLPIWEVMMLQVNIPGDRELVLAHAVFDFNGTLGFDGILIENVKGLLARLKTQLHCLIATADTHGTAAEAARTLGIEWVRVANGEEKAELVRSLDQVVAVGNGRNDIPMLRAAALGILVVGPEGTSAQAIGACDLLAPDIVRALELLLNPNRLIASLRM